MLTLLIVCFLILILSAALVGAFRRLRQGDEHGAEAFHAEPDFLVARGLLHPPSDKDDDKAGYAVTPAGEAALRAWLKEPTNDPGLLDQSFAAFVQPYDPVGTAKARIAVHEARLAEFERVEGLLSGRAEWVYALEAARVGVRFERHAVGFWEGIVAEESARLSTDKMLGAAS